MQIRTYPDREYSCHGELQRKFSQHAEFKGRLLIRSLLVCTGLFLGALVTGYFGIDIVTRGLLALSGTMLLSMFVFMLLHRMRPKCPICDSRMKYQYVGQPRGPGEDLYIVCHHCKIYADTHSSRE